MALTPGLYPTEGAVARILAAEKQIVAGISWRRDWRHDPDWAKFRVAVENSGGWSLTLHGNVRVDLPLKLSYLLSWTLGGKSYRIFSLDINGTHRNQRIDRNRWNQQTHKQRWRDEYHGFAFTPDETIPEEPIAAFHEFCAECNIVFTGQIGEIPLL